MSTGMLSELLKCQLFTFPVIFPLDLFLDQLTVLIYCHLSSKSLSRSADCSYFTYDVGVCGVLHVTAVTPIICECIGDYSQVNLSPPPPPPGGHHVGILTASSYTCGYTHSQCSYSQSPNYQLL